MEWYTNIYKSFIFASILAFLIGFFSDTQVATDAYIAGYSTLLLAIVIIMTIVIVNLYDKGGGTLLEILNAGGPFILMMAVIAFLMYLIVKYRNNILNNRVSTGYFTFTNITVMLLLFQLYYIYTTITTKEFEQTRTIPKVTNGIIYLFAVLLTITSTILYTILTYFTTDGFTTSLLSSDLYDQVEEQNDT